MKRQICKGKKKEEEQRGGVWEGEEIIKQQSVRKSELAHFSDRPYSCCFPRS